MALDVGNNGRTHRDIINDICGLMFPESGNKGQGEER